MIKFDISGPVFENDGSPFQFKRITQGTVYKWELMHSVVGKMSEARRKEFNKAIGADIKAKSKLKGKKNPTYLWNFYSESERSDVLALTPKFCIDFCESVGKFEGPIQYDEFTEEQKITFWDVMEENKDFTDWLIKYKAGTEKKPSPVVKGN